MVRDGAVDRIRPTQVTVSSTAMGSFNPASASRIAPSRSRRRRARADNNRNTAAASVEATIDPISKPSSQSTPSRNRAATPVSAAVIRTPAVANTAAGAPTPRKSFHRVRRPPSNRMTARAMLPTR